MKKIFTIILLTLLIVNNLFAQDDENQYDNTGLNFMLETSFVGNSNHCGGAIDFTIGNHINNNLFIGGGIKHEFGSLKSEYHSSRIDNMYTDNHGDRWYYHGWDQNGNELYINSKADLGYIKNSNGEIESQKIYDERGNEITNLPANSALSWMDYYDECGEDEDWAYAKIVPYLCLKYNFINYPKTPYIDLRLGWNVARNQEYLKYGADITALIGARIGVGDGHFAFNISTGYNYSDLRGFDARVGREHSFIFRFGVEF